MAPISEPAGAVAAARETRSRAPLAVVAHLAAGPASAEAAPPNPSDLSRSRRGMLAEERGAGFRMPAQYPRPGRLCRGVHVFTECSLGGRCRAVWSLHPAAAAFPTH